MGEKMNQILQKLEDDTKYCISVAKDVVIENQITYEKASAFLKTIKDLTQKIKESFDPIIEKAHQAHKEALAQRDKHLDPIKQAEILIKSKISNYLAICEKKRQEEQERLQREADKKAQKERDRLQVQADKASASGKEEKAQELLNKIDQVESIVPIAGAVVQKVEGMSVRKIWKARVVDFNILSNEYKLPNQQLLDGIARTSKGQMKISGVEFYTEDSVVLK
jgi:hypothetical protein